jgi:hypothetical protein
MPEPTLAIQVPAVTHERLDDEVIAINLETGIYYALVGTAADIWSSFDPASTVDDVADQLTCRYDADPSRVRRDVEAFARRLQRAGLLTRRADGDGEHGPSLPPLSPGAAWNAPELEEYRDMADLVLLDPIHQVDETGWPRLPDTPE